MSFLDISGALHHCWSSTNNGNHGERCLTKEVVEDPVAIPRRISETWSPQLIDDLPDAFCEMLLKHEVRNPELKKELEKHIRRSKDGSVEKGKYKDYVRDDNEDSAEVEYIASKRRKNIKRIRM